MVEDARDLADRISVESKRLPPWFETRRNAIAFPRSSP
jgi:hypothetical protein